MKNKRRKIKKMRVKKIIEEKNKNKIKLKLLLFTNY